MWGDVKIKIYIFAGTQCVHICVCLYIRYMLEHNDPYGYNSHMSPNKDMGYGV
jgi:hypothetical protein